MDETEAMAVIDIAMKKVSTGIKEVYSKESGISVNDPFFWEKLATFKAMQEDSYSPDDEDNCCPYCGREWE